MAALLKERLRESTLTENLLVLPGQVLQPEAKGGGNPYRKHRELKSAVLGHTELSNRPQYHAQTAIITHNITKCYNMNYGLKIIPVHCEYKHSLVRVTVKLS